MMRRHLRLGMLNALLVASAMRPAAAQTVDSVSLALDSRYIWRSYDRGGAVVRASAGIGLAGFSTNHSSKERNDVRLELASWNALTHRATRSRLDQYRASLRYGRCIASCDFDEWNKRWSLAVAVNEYALPHASGDNTSTEAEVAVRGYWDFERQGSTQLAINLSPYLTIDRDFHQSAGTYSALGVSTFLDAIGPFSAELAAESAVSDLPGERGSRSFGYHGSLLRLNLMRNVSIGEARHAELLLGGTLNGPSGAIGATTGMVTARFKLIGPIFQ